MNKNAMKDLYKTLLLSFVIFVVLVVAAYINFNYSVVEIEQNEIIPTEESQECQKDSPDYLSCLAVGVLDVGDSHEFVKHQLNRFIWFPMVFENDNYNGIIVNTDNKLIVSVPSENNTIFADRFRQKVENYTSILLIYWYGVSFIIAIPVYFIFKLIFKKRNYDTTAK